MWMSKIWDKAGIIGVVYNGINIPTCITYYISIT